MSEVARVNPDELPDPVCDYCSSFITDDDQECPALDDGEVCAP